MNFIRASVFFILNLVLLVTSVSAQAINQIELDHYNYLGNSTWEIASTSIHSSETGDIYAYQPYLGNPSYEQSLSVNYYAFDSSRWIYLYFSTDALGVPLGIGTYENAERFPFNSIGHPGLDYVNTGFGFNTLNGRFEVFDIQRNDTGVVTAFAGSFEIPNQVGGRVWFNSDHPMTVVPEPESWALFATGLMVLPMLIKRRRRGLGKK